MMGSLHSIICWETHLLVAVNGLLSNKTENVSAGENTRVFAIRHSITAKRWPVPP